jgi:hypothetical protein
MPMTHCRTSKGGIGMRFLEPTQRKRSTNTVAGRVMVCNTKFCWNLSPDA